MTMNESTSKCVFSFPQWRTARMNRVQKSMAIRWTALPPPRRATLQSIRDSHRVESLLPEAAVRPARTTVGSRVNSKVSPRMETTTTKRLTKIRHQGKPSLPPPPLSRGSLFLEIVSLYVGWIVCIHLRGGITVTVNQSECHGLIENESEVG